MRCCKIGYAIFLVTISFILDCFTILSVILDLCNTRMTYAGMEIARKRGVWRIWRQHSKNKDDYVDSVLLEVYDIDQSAMDQAREGLNEGKY